MKPRQLQKILKKNKETTTIDEANLSLPLADYNYRFSFQLVGAQHVGKTSLLFRYKDDAFVEGSINSMAQSAVKQLTLGTQKITTEVNETTQHSRFRPIENTLYRTTHVFIVMFDLTDRESFHDAEWYIKEIEKKSNDIPIVLVGTKSDRVTDRAIDCDAVEKMVEKNPKRNIQYYIETSSKNDQNVDFVFKVACKVAIEHHVQKKIIESNSKANDKNPRCVLINDLKTYIEKIEAHTKEGLPDFAYGFWHHKDSRAVNREANYYLAIELRDRLLSTEEPISEIFSNVSRQRDDLIRAKNLDVRPYFINRGINSDDLNKIIKDAKKLTGNETATIKKRQ